MSRKLALGDDWRTRTCSRHYRRRRHVYRRTRSAFRAGHPAGHSQRRVRLPRSRRSGPQHRRPDPVFERTLPRWFEGRRGRRLVRRRTPHRGLCSARPRAALLDLRVRWHQFTPRWPAQRAGSRYLRSPRRGQGGSLLLCDHRWDGDVSRRTRRGPDRRDQRLGGPAHVPDRARLMASDPGGPGQHKRWATRSRSRMTHDVTWAAVGFRARPAGISSFYRFPCPIPTLLQTVVGPEEKTPSPARGPAPDAREVSKQTARAPPGSRRPRRLTAGPTGLAVHARA
jgi:hypothetical protein